MIMMILTKMRMLIALLLRFEALMKAKERVKLNEDGWA